MKKIDLVENKAFCILPFIHLHVTESNNVKLCCVAYRDIIDKYSKEFDFKNHPELVDIRQRLINGERIKHCSDCYELDDGNTDSLRTRDTRDWLRKLNITTYDELKADAIYYDIRNDNLCNLSCRMCGPQSSSQLEKEFKEIGWSVPQFEKSFSANDVINLDTVKQVYIAGGEPSIMPEFRKFLKRAVSEGKTDFELRISSNATNLNSEYVNLLKNFKNLHITVSVDGFDKVNRYIRWPSDWKQFIKNVHELYSIATNISFNTTVSIWNISKLSPMVFALEKEFTKPDLLLNRVFFPSEQRFQNFPAKDIALADLEKIKESWSYNYNDSFKSRIDFYISELRSSTVDLELLEKFFDYNDVLDKSRDTHLKDYIPELELCRDLIKKPI